MLSKDKNNRSACANASLTVAALTKLRTAAIIGGAIAIATPAFGSTIASIEGQASGTSASFSGVVTGVLSVPGTGDGYTYTNNSFLVNDGTGSLDVFGKIPTATPYTPTLGDGVSASGTYSPFDGIPEVESLTSITKGSGGNAVASPILVTAPQANAAAGNYSLLEYLVQLDNVTLSAGTVAVPVTTWPTHANEDFNITDASSNVLDGYLWASSYSIEDQFAGQPIPTGPVDITGFLSTFTSAGSTVVQLTPTAIVSVPEPVSAGILAIGAGAMLMRRRRTA